MDKSSYSRINWLNVIISCDFFEYLDLELLKEVSLISKLVREKIKPHLFRSLELSTNIFALNFKGNIFVEHINRYIYPEYYRSNTREQYSYLKCLSVENSIKDFSYLLNNVKKFAKSLKFEEAKKVEYYLFPIINIFDNLVFLKMNCCSIPLDGFNKIGKSLLNLRDLEIANVIFYKLPSDNIKPTQIIFSHMLRYLNIHYCMVASSNLISDPYEFFSNQNPQETYSSFNLPKIFMRSLKNLSYYYYGDSDREFKSFLEINNHLETLKIESFNMGHIVELRSLKCLDIYNIEYINTKEKALALRYLEKLSINNVYPKNYENIRILCSLCPNLEDLRFCIRDGLHFQNSIDSFLTPLMSNLPLLKSLNLIFGTSKDDKLNFTKISNIESLIIDTDNSTILNLNFEGCAKLKKVKFISYLGEVNTQEFRDRFNSYKNWKFRFSSDTIKGYKIN